MAKNDYLKMLSYGEWLCKLVDDNIKIYQLEELGEDAIKLLNINFVDRSVFFFGSLPGKEKDSFHDSWKYVKPLGPPLWRGSDDVEEGKLSPEDETSINEWNSLPNFITAVKDYLREIKHSKQPWTYTVHKDSDLPELPPESNIYSLERPYNLVKAYSRLSDCLDITRSGVTKKFSFVGPYIFEWTAVISRIFFDFLILGGQEYYGYCEHCDNFFVIQRKGRKIYCSDICRVNSNKLKANR